MEDKLKELEELIGTDRFNRVLRIMSFIGAKFPDEIDDLASYNEQDQFLRLVYFIALVVLVSFIFHLFCKILKNHLNTGFMIGYTIALYSSRYSVSIISYLPSCVS